MNDIEMRKAFEKMLENIDTRIFLKASPLESGERSKLDKALSEDMYYESLYAHSKAADDLIEEIKNKIIAEDTHNFILSGYKGCGKSTFVGYFLRNIDSRNLLINCDDYWEPREGIYHNIVMFVYNKIVSDFFPERDEDVCKISEKYIEIFHDTSNAEFMESNVDLYNFFTYFTHKLSYVMWKRKCGQCNHEHMRAELRQHVKKHIISGSISELLMLLVFWDTTDRIVNHGQPECCVVFENLDVIHNTKDVPELVKNIVAFRNNVDKVAESILYQGRPICDPTKDYVLLLVMRETTKAEFTNSIAHFSDGKIRFQHFMSVSKVYDLYDIISARYRYLDKIKNKYLEFPKFSNMYQSIANMRAVLTNQGVRERIFAIFNNDYRTCVEALERIGFSNQRLLEAYARLSQIPDTDKNWPVFGYRSVIFRQVFNAFVNDVFNNMVRQYEYSISDNGRIGSINLDRMILLYLFNSQNMMISDEKDEKEYVPLNVLYSEILKFCSDSEKIVKAIWNMYDLQNTDMWNHLVTFDDMRVITVEELRSEMDAVLQKKSGIHFAKIKITLAGQIYLNNILPHFEYYASRSDDGKGYSLFSLTAEELCNIRSVEKRIKDERKEVLGCCKRLHLFFDDVFEKIDGFRGNDFLGTKFASVKVSSTQKTMSRMYHCEKIIYSNIGYLDSFRFFVFYMMDTVEKDNGFESDVEITEIVRKYSNFSKCVLEEFPKEMLDSSVKRIVLKKKNEEQVIELQYDDGSIKQSVVQLNTVIRAIKICYNKTLIEAIVEFMKMFGFYHGNEVAKHSNGTKNICYAFDACIYDNIIPSGYGDFETHITYETGEQILADRRRRERKNRQEKRKREYLERKKQMGL